jgi:hypothetical protein
MVGPHLNGRFRITPVKQLYAILVRKSSSGCVLGPPHDPSASCSERTTVRHLPSITPSQPGTSAPAAEKIAICAGSLGCWGACESRRRGGGTRRGRPLHAHACRGRRKIVSRSHACTHSPSVWQWADSVSSRITARGSALASYSSARLLPPLVRLRAPVRWTAGGARRTLGIPSGFA